MKIKFIIVFGMFKSLKEPFSICVCDVAMSVSNSFHTLLVLCSSDFVYCLIERAVLGK